MSISAKRSPAQGAVIIGSPSAETLTRVEQAVERPLEAPPGASDTFIVKSKSGDPRAICDMVKRIVGNEGIVGPLLVDDDGNQLIPTGRIQVRFKEQLADDCLTAFAEGHNVILTKRNKWNLKQAEFIVRNDDDRFWLDIIEAIAADRNVEAVWLDVKARFRREIT